MENTKNKGILFALGAYGIWGLFPIYWKMINNVSALEILANRIFWSFVLTAILVIVLKKGQEVKTIVKDKKQLLMAVMAAIFVSVNWGIYIFAVNAGRIVDASLGYYINPLLSVMLGMLLFKEKLSTPQKISLVIAAVGVAIKTIEYGQIPWISLLLAGSFGIYGVIKKQVNTTAITGLFLETGTISALALAYMLFGEFAGPGTYQNSDSLTVILLVGAGVVTSIPLLLFARGAKMLPLTIMGLTQYVTPTMQLLIGVVMYGEPFGSADLISFCFIWGALVIYTLSQFVGPKRKVAVDPAN